MKKYRIILANGDICIVECDAISTDTKKTILYTSCKEIVAIVPVSACVIRVYPIEIK